MRFREFQKSRQQIARCEGARRGQANRPDEAFPDLRRVRERSRMIVHERGAARNLLPERGQPVAGAIDDEQRASQRRLETLQPPRHGRVLDLQFLGGRGKRPRLRQGEQEF